MKKHMNYIFVIAYLLFAQTAVLLVKLGSTNTSLTFQNGDLSISVNIKMLLGLCLYVCSFLLWIVVLSRNDLSVVTPIITGANYIIPMAIGVAMLHERMSTQQWVGAAVILAGLIICNFRGNNISY